MSVNKTLQASKLLKVLSVGLLLGGASFLAASYVMTPATAPVSQKPSMLSGPAKLGAFAGKAHQGMQARIAALDEITDNSEAEIRIRARLQIQKSSEAGKSFVYRFELPADVRLVSGDQNGVIEALEVGQIWEQIITVRGLSAVGKNQNVKFSVDGTVEGQKISADAILSSRPMQKDLTRAQFDPDKSAVSARSSSNQKLSGDEASEDKGHRPPKGIKF